MTEFTTDKDGWGYREGSRFATPEECADVDVQIRRGTTSPMTDPIVFQAFVHAADKLGRIMNHELDVLYEQHVTAVLRDEDDEPGWKLEYDRFVAGALMESSMRLIQAGYLAQRGNGDSSSYRLTLPTE